MAILKSLLTIYFNYLCAHFCRLPFLFKLVTFPSSFTVLVYFIVCWTFIYVWRIKNHRDSWLLPERILCFLCWQTEWESCYLNPIQSRTGSKLSLSFSYTVYLWLIFISRVRLSQTSGLDPGWPYFSQLWTSVTVPVLCFRAKSPGSYPAYFENLANTEKETWQCAWSKCLFPEHGETERISICLKEIFDLCPLAPL